jgi:hypothetical protein
VKDLTPTGERADGRTGLIVNENGRIPQAHKAFDYYEAILYSFYNKEFTVDDTDMPAALSDCYQLLQISDYLGCTSLISKPIEVALLKHGQDLFRAIQGAPYLWVEMAYRIRSEMIFKECMVHLVGNWKTMKIRPRINEDLREVPGLRALIEKYHRALLTQCKNLELAVMALYPGDMCVPVKELPIKREAYAKDILVWMALSFFRHWVGQRLILEKGRHAMDCGYELYKAIGTAGESYMDKSVINQFHAKFPMTKKAVNVLENHLFEIKECMKAVVDQHKVLRSTTQLDIHRFPVAYLTCTDFKREDCPWLSITSEPARIVPAKREYKPGGNDIARQNLATTKRIRERSLSVDVGDVDAEDGDVEDDFDDFDDDGGEQQAKYAQSS